jgi:hypothetical protein
MSSGFSERCRKNQIRRFCSHVTLIDEERPRPMIYLQGSSIRENTLRPKE